MNIDLYEVLIQIKEQIKSTTDIKVTTDHNLVDATVFGITGFSLNTFYLPNLINHVTRDLITFAESRDYKCLNICNLNQIVYTQNHQKQCYYTQRDYLLFTICVKGSE